MKTKRMTKEQWTEELYRLLCESQRPENDSERKNIREWAELISEPESGYFQDGYTPKEAHDEELSYGY